MAERHWLHMIGFLGAWAYPVQVLSRGPKWARVRLLHKTRRGRRWYPRGSEWSRVPVACLRECPIDGALVSKGGGRFEW